MDKSIVAALHLTLIHKYRCLTITPTVLQRPGYPVPQVPRPSSLHFYTVTIMLFYILRYRTMTKGSRVSASKVTRL